jgi:predicted RNase H-like nuclease (RuvC/YqgF family)
MRTDRQNIEIGFNKLEAVAKAAAAKIDSLKQNNKELKGEVNELKRLLALSEKKAERIKLELDELKSNGKQDWRLREKDIKERLVRLSAKISAFENNL